MMKLGDMIVSMVRLVFGLTILGTLVFFGYCLYDRSMDFGLAAGDVAAMWQGVWANVVDAYASVVSKA